MAPLSQEKEPPANPGRFIPPLLDRLLDRALRRLIGYRETFARIRCAKRGLNLGKLAYRPEIDGLRAVAVTSVLLFHLDKSWLPGGFIGVDIFFVISGFLITRLLVSDLETGTLNLPRFYQRRIARLAPMMIVVIAATVGAGLFVLSPQDLASTAVNAVAALLSVANIKFLLQGDCSSSGILRQMAS
jgi:hypothetical protein